MKALRSQGLGPDGDYIRTWKVYISKGIEGVRESFSDSS